MNRRVGLITLFLVAAFALPATAQVRKRDHRKKRPANDQEVVKARRGGKGTAPIRVTGFSPRSGGAGTLVRIDGSGFNKKTKLLFGGKRLRPKKLQRAFITFVVPRRFAHGEIVLRHPNMADDLVVGEFELIEDPAIKSFSPRSGLGGTRIEIRGTGFRKGDQVLINNRSVTISKMGPKRILATIPPNASTDYLIVSRPGGVQARSRKQFRVVQPAPAISGISPRGGPGGTTVRVTGSGFTERDKVLYGRRPLSVTGSTATWVDVVVPNNARADQFISVRNQWGAASSAQRFQLERPAAIARFAPLYGVVGQRVDIYGANFMARDRITLNGQRLKILQLRPKQISVEIPNGATTGALVLERGRTRVSSKKSFEVVYSPSVSGFSPSTGEVGTRVTITGSHFSRDAAVFFGRQKLRTVQRSDSAITVAIPNRATDQFFTVRTKGGESSTQTRFQVFSFSTVTGLKPKKGPAGTRVLITGKNFSRNDRFFLGQLELPVEERRPNKVWVSIPDGARSARLTWDSHGQRTQSPHSFTVLQAPVISNYGPHAGAPGTQITINGDQFTRKTRVLWGNQQLKIVRRQLPTQLVAIIPKNAKGTKYVWAVDAGARIRSGKAFQVVAPPVILGFSPRFGPPGTEITLAGDNFTKATTARIGRTALAIVRWTPTSIVVRVPKDTPAGKDYLWVEQDRNAERARKPFAVTAFASITRFKPDRVKPQQRVELFGDSFSNSTKVFWGQKECEIVRVGKRGRKMQIRVPADANGKRYLWVQDGGNRARSPDKLEVMSAKPAREKVPVREKVPARRGKKHRRGNR